jgi:hypothetical protein
MAETLTFDRILWGATFSLNAGLVVLLLYRKNHRVLPFFFFYALLDLLHGVVVLESYRIWGFNSPISFKIAWGSEGLVIVARALAVAEVCRLVLAKYRGIWALGWRIFLAAGFLLLAYAWTVGGHSWRLVTLTAHRSLELAMAAAILALFVFAHYYQVVVEATARFLAIGFFLYSCFQVLNDTILERWLTHYSTLWNLIGTLTFLASLLLWTWALRLTQQHLASEPDLLPENRYRSLSPAINARLKSLNERLSHFWGAEEERT